MLIITVLVTQTTGSVSVQEAVPNIRWPVKLLTWTDVQGQLVKDKKAEGRKKGGFSDK